MSIGNQNTTSMSSFMNIQETETELNQVAPSCDSWGLSLKTTFDMTTLILSSRGAPLVPPSPLESAPHILPFAANDRETYK